MIAPGPSIYFGTVTHKRLRPVLHELSYNVAAVMVDVDELSAGRTPRLLGHNRFNLFSVHDADHGELEGGELKGSQTIAAFAWGKVRDAGLEKTVRRILMLSYPRILGYAFNPLTAYYALDGEGRTRLMIYEVHNTFGGRHTYVSDPLKPAAVNYHHTEKRFPVSPFNRIEGAYGLRATEPGERLSLGVSLSTAEGPLLKAYFHGKRAALTDRMLLGLFLRFPFMSLKVIGGIHWEALKLWLKGLNLQRS